jgi:hypothetical protein
MGIRQQAVALFKGREAEGIVVSDKHSPHYLKEMLNATFCPVFPGNGWGHIESPLMLGCIPVVVQVRLEITSPRLLSPRLLSPKRERNSTFHEARLEIAVGIACPARWPWYAMVSPRGALMMASAYR